MLCLDTQVFYSCDKLLFFVLTRMDLHLAFVRNPHFFVIPSDQCMLRQQEFLLVLLFLLAENTLSFSSPLHCSLSEPTDELSHALVARGKTEWPP